MPETVVDVSALGYRLTLSESHRWEDMTSALEETKGRTEDLSVPFRDFQDTWFENEKQIFDAEGIPTWPALSPAYEAWKSVHFPGKPILQRTGRLMDSLTSQTEDTIYDVSPTQLVVGTAVEYSSYHQDGGQVLPQRVHVEMLEPTFEQLNSDVFLYVTEPLNRGG
jgi:phage gpG-like protein